MTQFTGICSFPHGGWVSVGLLLATCIAFVTTTYSVVSCRILVLTFVSESGNFEQTFARTQQVETSPTAYKVAIGLFQWLRPNVSYSQWEDGTCVGYQETMTEIFSEKYFEVARSAGSVAVLLSVVVVLWSIFGVCFAWNTWQIIILAFLLLCGTVATLLSFALIESDLCNAIFDDSSCELDEGGLILIAGGILWVASFLLTVIFMRTLDNRINDQGLSEVERARARQMSMIAEKRARDKERREMQREYERERQLDQVPTTSYEEEDATPPSKVRVTPSTDRTNRSFDDNQYRHQEEEKIRATVIALEADAQEEYPTEEVLVPDESVNPNEYEVYISSRIQRIDDILRDIQSSEDQQDEERMQQHLPAEI